MLQRRQLVLDDKITLALAQMAREEGRSASALVREILAEKIEQRKKIKVKKINAVQMILEGSRRLEKMGLKGAADSSTNDDYIYR